jgi:hypothetical protein
MRAWLSSISVLACALCASSERVFSSLSFAGSSELLLLLIGQAEHAAHLVHLVAAHPAMTAHVTVLCQCNQGCHRYCGP